MKMPPLPEEKPAVTRSRWLPPETARSFFSPAADFEFKQAHPVGYFFLVLLGVAVFIAPMAGYGFYCTRRFGDGEANIWFILGLLGSMSVGVGLFNIVGIIIKQYLGHLVTLVSIVLGFALMALGVYLY